MKPHEAISSLDQLLGTVCRSLPAYLADARPWSRWGSRELQTALDRLAADQRMYAGRVAEAIGACGGQPRPGGFPAEFTAKNDLSLQFLLGEIIDCLEQDAELIERLAAQLESDPALHALAMEILGNVKGHADVLKERMRDEG